MAERPLDGSVDGFGRATDPDGPVSNFIPSHGDRARTRLSGYTQQLQAIA
jgi:hypothetical protein